ncbi:MAG: VOC family protein [Rhodoferax sp.]|nr:VOC family protein [Rhodoferax sp.]
MAQYLGLVSLVLRDYDEPIDCYVNRLGFCLVEDLLLPYHDKRWVVVAPAGTGPAKLLLARAEGPDQLTRVGNQTGGRVFLFLHTDDFERDYLRYKSAGVVFVREPVVAPYGTVAVFSDLYGILWGLIGPTAAAPDSA